MQLEQDGKLRVKDTDFYVYLDDEQVARIGHAKFIEQLDHQELRRQQYLFVVNSDRTISSVEKFQRGEACEEAIKMALGWKVTSVQNKK